MGAPPHAPGDFLAKRKSPKIRQEPPGSWTSSTRGRTPLDSPALCPSGIVRGNLNHQASSGGTPPAMPRIDSRECFPDGTEGKNKTDLPSNLKWQIGLFLWLRVARVQAKRSTNEGGKFAPGDSNGRSPWRAFGDFPRDGTVTRVQGGAPASGGAGATSSA